VALDKPEGLARARSRRRDESRRGTHECVRHDLRSLTVKH
jgi:hypothetical protein